MRNVVIYHKNCCDGFTAAWAASKFLPDDTLFIPKHPEISVDKIPEEIKGAHVYLLDLAFKKSILLKMKAVAKKLLVLDHHITAYEALKDLDFCYFDMNKSGAGLAWDYFSQGMMPPLLVKYVEDRDLWRFSLTRSREINAVFFSYEKTFENWDILATTSKKDLIMKGEILLHQEMTDIKTHLSRAKLIDFLGYQVPACICTLSRIKSDVAAALAQDTNLFAVACQPIGKDEVAYSLRSRPDGMDVSKLAFSLGGGGHKHAAGFKGPLRLIEDLLLG